MMFTIFLYTLPRVILQQGMSVNRNLSIASTQGYSSSRYLSSTALLIFLRRGGGSLQMDQTVQGRGVTLTIIFQISHCMIISTYEKAQSWQTINQFIIIMVIFNQTFAPDREIIFPDNWKTGKTIVQLFDQTRSTLPWIVAAHLLQIAAACAWLFLLFVIFKANHTLITNFKQRNLPYKVQYRKAFKLQTLSFILFISGSCYFLTMFLAIQSEWVRWVLVKGGSVLVLYFLALSLSKGLRKGK